MINFIQCRLNVVIMKLIVQKMELLNLDARMSVSIDYRCQYTGCAIKF